MLLVHQGLTLLAVAALALPATAQLTDLQPGRNYPTATEAFGTGRSENIDVGDIDNDGDGDVAVANGGYGAPQQNRIYVNLGGTQGGTPGTFADETDTRFAGLPVDTSRDIEFADFDGDYDLDVFVCNRGTVINGGEVCRAYVNLGGQQLGAIGFFSEGSDGFWGTLLSIPPASEEGAQDGQGPWLGHAQDADFADINDDGFLDLFLTATGPNLGGTQPLRIFLNDGSGRFDELWPWADAGADVILSAMDCDLADLDDDFDLDVFASDLGHQARIYRNNLAPSGWSGDPFTDRTQSALLDTQAEQVGGNNYEVEFGDLDGDGDFDLWLQNYNNFFDVTLRNEGDFTFTVADWIRNNPSDDESEVDFLDYDSDGDLDAFLAGFVGTSYLYVGALAQQPLGGGETGLYFRTGFIGGLAAWPEVPASGNGGYSLDGEMADLDLDGDPDLLLANDGNGPNHVWPNLRGVPDTHAPSFHQVTLQGDKADGSDTVLHAQIRDNASIYTTAAYDVRLVYSVDGGVETCLPMAAQGGMQFRAVIPGGLDGTIAYRVEATDLAGNTGISATTVYAQTSSGVTLWQSLDCGTLGVSGRPSLSLAGTQLGGEPLTLRLRDAAPGALFLLWLATPVSAPVSALGGTIYAFPYSDQFLLATDAGGLFVATVAWPPGVPAGVDHTWQVLVADPVNLYGIALSNAVKGTTP